MENGTLEAFEFDVENGYGFFPFVSLYRLAFMENDKNTANTVVLV